MMASRPLVPSTSYVAVVRGIRELHRLALAGRDQSTEADLVRDATDGPWAALSEAERKRASGLSEDLYSISDPTPTKGEAPSAQAQAKLIEVVEARQRGEWDRALELLRQWGKHFSPAVVSYLRGLIWSEAGDPDAAVLFFEHASKLEQDNGGYLGRFLDALHDVDKIEAQRRAKELVDQPDTVAPIALVGAANILYRAAQAGPSTNRADVFSHLITVLEANLRNIEAGAESGVSRLSYTMTLTLLGLCHAELGHSQEALTYYSRGLSSDPFNDSLLVARGILLYGSSPRAISDLELAVRNRSSSPLPYAFLAHHYLMTGRFTDCRTMCEQALRLASSATLKSQLAEWTAISQAELGFPKDIVEASFELAIRLDPSNETARRNLAVFESGIATPRTRQWETPSEAVVRPLGQSEERYATAS